jgi:maleylpyruvate isomerase
VPLPQDATSADAVLADVGARTIGLLRYAGGLDDDAVREPAALPGWSRGHVLTHLADNAAAFVAVLRRARDADDAGPMYPSKDARDADVEAGSRRPAQDQRQRLADSADELTVTWRALPAERLHATFSGTAGWTRPVLDVPWMRWRELALHAVDLGLPARLAPGDPFAARLLDETAQAWADRADAPAMDLVDTERRRTWRVGTGDLRVEGATADLALWLTGRGDGGTLSASGPLPTLPPWL